MTIEDLDVLRSGLPEVFRDSVMPSEWDEGFIFVPVDQPLGAIPGDLADWVDDLPVDFGDILGPLDLPPGLTGEFPGSPQGMPVSGSPEERTWPVGRTGQPLPPAVPPDCLAFYLPFHYFYPDWWGVYLTIEGTAAVARFIHAFDPTILSFRDAYLAAQVFLYGHEHYHHKVECFSTKLEVTHREPLYKTAFEKVYQAHVGTLHSSEEILATAYGYRKALEPFKGHPVKRYAVSEALKLYIWQLPSGYREASGVLSLSSSRLLEVEFAEENQRTAFPSKKSQIDAIWLVFPNAFQGISRRTSRVNYIIRRHSALAQRSGLALRYLRYKQVVEKLGELAGCTFDRPGKGGHEIWRSANGNQVVIPRHPGDLSTGTLKSIIKQAGLPYSIEQFVNAKGRQIADRLPRVIS